MCSLSVPNEIHPLPVRDDDDVTLRPPIRLRIKRTEWDMWTVLNDHDKLCIAHEVAELYRANKKNRRKSSRTNSVPPRIIKRFRRQAKFYKNFWGTFRNWNIWDYTIPKLDVEFNNCKSYHYVSPLADIPSAEIDYMPWDLAFQLDFLSERDYRSETMPFRLHRHDPETERRWKELVLSKHLERGCLPSRTKKPDDDDHDDIPMMMTTNRPSPFSDPYENMVLEDHFDPASSPCSSSTLKFDHEALQAPSPSSTDDMDLDILILTVDRWDTLPIPGFYVDRVR